MLEKLKLAVCAILLTALAGVVLAQQKPEQKAEQKSEQKAEQKSEPTAADADQKTIKVRAGEVVSVDAIKNELIIKDDAGTEIHLLIGGSTQITRAGKSIALADVKAGDKISSKCAESSDGCKAKSIQVMPAEPGQ